MRFVLQRKLRFLAVWQRDRDGLRARIFEGQDKFKAVRKSKTKREDKTYEYRATVILLSS